VAAPPASIFEYKMAGADLPPRSTIDIAVAARSPNAGGGLWVAPPGFSEEPDPTATADLVDRWTVRPFDRVREPRRVFLVLRPAGACRAGDTLWARLRLDGDWLAPADRGERTVGGVLTDCRAPALILEIPMRNGSRKG
jgi:hypothetical protein